MHYEAKHSYLKQIAYVIKNFINIPKSLAYHHQRQMCYRMADKYGYLNPKEVHGPGTMILLMDKSDFILFIIVTPVIAANLEYFNILSLYNSAVINSN